jgi:hypothetical protein
MSCGFPRHRTKGGPNHELHTDRGRIVVPRDTMLFQRPRRVNWVIRSKTDG